MLQSNQPYQKAHDSAFNGAVYGGLAGGALVGGINYGSNKYISHIDEQMKKAASPSKAANIGDRFLPQLAMNTQDKMFGGDIIKHSKNVPFASKGVGARGAITAGAGIIGGSILGALIDG